MKRAMPVLEAAAALSSMATLLSLSLALGVAVPAAATSADPLPLSSSSVEEETPTGGGPIEYYTLGASGGQIPLVWDWLGSLSSLYSYSGLDAGASFTFSESAGVLKSRLGARVDGNLRLAYRGEESAGSQLAPLAFVRVVGEWDSRWVGLGLGGWIGNLGNEQSLAGFASASLRLGTRSRHLRVALFDQPNSLPATSLLGVEGLYTFRRFGIRAGYSAGLGSQRGYLQIPIALGKGSHWIEPGLEAGVDTWGDAFFSISLSFGFRP